MFYPKLDANAFREGELMTRGLFWALEKMVETGVVDRVTFEGQNGGVKEPVACL